MRDRPSEECRDLEFAVTKMRQGVMRLLYNPYTFKEMVLDVAQTQRYYLDALAMCEFAEEDWATRLSRLGPVSKHLYDDRLGAWSTDPSTVQSLYHAGIPVYYVRPIHSLTGEDGVPQVLTKAVRDGSVDTRDWDECGVLMSFPTRFAGPPSESLHQALSEENRYRDLEEYFLELNGDRALTPVGMKSTLVNVPPYSQKRSKRSKGIRSATQIPMPARDKWIELKGDLIPLSEPTWALALLSVDRSVRSPTAPPKPVSGYRFPDPGMLIYSEGRRDRNIFNWLAIRQATIRRASNDAASSHAVPLGISNELWRLYISSDFSEDAWVPPTVRGAASSRPRSDNISRRQLLVDIFGRPPDSQHLRHVEWHGFVVEWGKITMHDNMLVREILWDLHQWSFQYDLIAIDRYLAPGTWARASSSRYILLDAVCGGYSCLAVVPRPDSNFGMASTDEDARHAAYGALKTLMESWEVSELVSVDANDELQVASAYCKIFAKTFGRPPILPKLIPKGNDCSGVYPYRRSG
ncbi:hypothetical protein HWV62_24460 [Athelia sp. TMB]|nr:hypothetical protein HWV62_24460 [Athelia sp. TMB]